MHDTINGAMFKEMLLFGTVSIAQAQQAINDLNVFCRFSSAASPRSSRAARRPTARRLPPRFRRVSPRRITP